MRLPIPTLPASRVPKFFGVASILLISIAMVEPDTVLSRYAMALGAACTAVGQFWVRQDNVSSEQAGGVK